jgi:branched-chain amino acid transport system substrate-binding protein
MKIESILATNNTVEQPNFFNDAGAAAEGVIFTTPLFDPDSSDPSVAQFREAFKRKYDGLSPEVSAATWYDTIKILAVAIERGGYNAEGIRQALSNIKDYKGATGTISIREDRDVDKPVVVKVVRNGKFVPWSAQDK